MKTLTLLAAIALTSCAVTTTPDGTRTQTVDPVVYHAGVILLSEYAIKHAVRPDK